MKLDFESAEAGTPLESISIPALNRVGLARYAGAVDDFGAVHLDDKVAKAAGKASVFAPGTLVMAYLGRVVQASLEGASLRRFGLRITRLLWPGDVLDMPRWSLRPVKKTASTALIWTCGQTTSVARLSRRGVFWRSFPKMAIRFLPKRLLAAESSMSFQKRNSWKRTNRRCL